MDLNRQSDVINLHSTYGKSRPTNLLRSTHLPIRIMRRRRRYYLLLTGFFFASLPLINPWVRGDGIGYYAYVRAPLIEHSLDFTRDYQHSNSRYLASRLDANGQPKREFLTPTRHLDNHFAIGPAILWAPFFGIAHLSVLAANALGWNIATDGYSFPYRYLTAFATCLYGFLSVLLSFQFSSRYVSPHLAFGAALTVWGASSLPVYMYFNPFWSHAHSAFVVALFICYWDSTRSNRSRKQWLLLGLLAGLMTDVYYPTIIAVSVVLIESVTRVWQFSQSREAKNHGRDELMNQFLFAASFAISLLPTFASKYLVYGNPLESGYPHLRSWLWTSPQFLNVLFSSNHGLLVWTPVVFISLIGLGMAAARLPLIGGSLLLCFLSFYTLISFYPDWAGISSFGNRFFISMTIIIVFGLAFLYQCLALKLRYRMALLTIAIASTFLVAWNAGLIFQWGLHFMPVRGPVPMAKVIGNQFSVVPVKFKEYILLYFTDRPKLMREIEQMDIEQLKENGEY